MGEKESEKIDIVHKIICGCHEWRGMRYYRL